MAYKNVKAAASVCLIEAFSTGGVGTNEKLVGAVSHLQPPRVIGQL